MRPDELARQDEDDLQWVVSTPQGQRFAARLIDRWARLEEKCETGEERSTAFNEGMREVGRCLLRAIELASSPKRFDELSLARNEARRELVAHRVHPEGEALD